MITLKATAARVDTKKTGETTDHKWRVINVEGDTDIQLDSEDLQPWEPKAKKVKVKMQDEINIAMTKNLKNEKEGNKYAKMVNSMGSDGKPVSKVPAHSPDLQAAASHGRPLRREGAIANIKKVVATGSGGKKVNKDGLEKSTSLNFPYSSTRPDPDR